MHVFGYSTCFLLRDLGPSPGNSQCTPWVILGTSQGSPPGLLVDIPGTPGILLGQLHLFDEAGHCKFHWISEVSPDFIRFQYISSDFIDSIRFIKSLLDFIRFHTISLDFIGSPQDVPRRYPWISSGPKGPQKAACRVPKYLDDAHRSTWACKTHRQCQLAPRGIEVTRPVLSVLIDSTDVPHTHMSPRHQARIWAFDVPTSEGP